MADMIGRASALLASGTVVSRILGFVKVVVLARTIGQTGVGADAFALANQLPNNIFLIVAGGVLSAILVPQIVRAGTGRDGGVAYTNKIVTLGIVVLAGTALLATIASPLVITLYGLSGLEAGTEQNQTLQLAIAFGFWCFPQVFFYGLYSLLGETLNARKVYGPFTWAPVLNNVVAIAGLLVFSALFGPDPYGVSTLAEWTQAQVVVLAGSATLGVAAQALVLGLFWRRAGLRFRPDFDWRGVGLRRTGKQAGWIFAMVVAMQIAGIVTNNVAFDATGYASVAVLANAWLLFMLPQSVITVSVTTVYFTRMSEHEATGDRAAIRDDLSAAIRLCGVLVTLAMAAMMVLAFPIASIFTSGDPWVTQAMAWVIVAHLAGLMFYTCVFVIQRTFYALGDTRTPFVFTVVQLAIFAGGSLVVAAAVPREHIAVTLASIESVSFVVQLVIAGVMLRRRMGVPLGLPAVFARLAVFLGAAAVAAVPGLAVAWAMGAFAPEGFAVGSIPGALLASLCVSGAMAAAYVAALALFRAPELGPALRPIAGRLARRRGRGPRE